MALRLEDDRHWTYEDYCQLPDDGTRYEVIDGRLYVTPAPRPVHQLVIKRLLLAFVPLEEAGRCFAYFSPLDVRVGGCDPVQPDLVVMRRDQRCLIGEKYVEGAPALVIEVLSPSNPRHDRVTKMGAYARAGIEGYWLADPEACSLEMFRLRDDQYVVAAGFGPGEIAASPDWPGFQLALDDLYRPLPED